MDRKSSEDQVTSMPPQSVSDSDLEPLEPPPGVLLDHPTDGAVRVQVRIGTVNRLLLALPRIVSLLAALVLLLEAWRHRVFIFFWFFGLPFLRWLRGPGQSSVLIGERALEVAGARFFGGTVLLPRRAITSVQIGRAGPLHAFQLALFAYRKDQPRTPLFVGLSPAQAEFVNGGLQRWLAGE